MADLEFEPILKLAEKARRERDHVTAVNSYKTILSVDAANHKAAIGLARCLCDLREFLRASEVIQSCLAGNQFFQYELYLELGVVLKRGGFSDQAIAAFEKTIEIKPSVEASVQLAEILIEKSAYRAADFCLKKALIIDGRNHHALGLKATIYELEGHLEKALEFYKRANSACDSDTVWEPSVERLLKLTKFKHEEESNFRSLLSEQEDSLDVLLSIV